ncbi:MAG: hypothetical protein ACM3QW_02425, partial [Ignavibacteriales bacterium]
MPKDWKPAWLKAIPQLVKYATVFIVCLMLPLLLISGVVLLATPRYTAPTRIIFTDQSNNTPVKDLKVKFTWLGFDGFIAVGSSWAYHTEEFTTAADGSVILPKVKRPFPVNFLIYQRDHMEIRIHLRSWNYVDNANSTWSAFGPFKILGNESACQIRLLPASNLDAQMQALDDNSGAFGKEFWQEGIAGIIAEHGLAALSTTKLSIIADTCAEYKGTSCEELDREVLRRNDNDTKKSYSARKAALRLGIVTPEMAQWFKLWEERNKAGKESSIRDDEEAA